MMANCISFTWAATRSLSPPGQKGEQSMKPLPGDYRHKLLISGDELEELKKHTYSMVEAFGLDRKIEKYMGTRPITLYRWDLECLMNVIDLALKDERDYAFSGTAPGKSGPCEAVHKLSPNLFGDLP